MVTMMPASGKFWIFWKGFSYFSLSRDLIRGKLVNLFKTEFRAELLGKHLSVEDRRMVKETGLLGGEIVLYFLFFPIYFSQVRRRSVLFWVI